jgi:hypothetical protein
VIAALLAASCGCTSINKWGKSDSEAKTPAANSSTNPLIPLTAPDPNSSGPTATSTAILSPTAWNPSPNLPAYSKQPAAQIAVSWRHWVDYLPDPAHEGRMSPGIAGQLFLFDAELLPALANGKLVVKLYDETTRPPGQQGIAPEIWEFNKETLKKLTSVDERFGRFYVLFLPLPTYRPDVTQVRITASYVEDGKTLYAQEANFPLGASPVTAATVQWKNETISPAEASQRAATMMTPPLGVIGSQYNGLPAANRQPSTSSAPIPYSGAPLTLVPSSSLPAAQQSQLGALAPAGNASGLSAIPSPNGLPPLAFTVGR